MRGNGCWRGRCWDLPDSKEITTALTGLYGVDDWLMNLNFQVLLRLSGIHTLSRQVNILDCGCAMGHFLRMLQRHGFSQVQGVDASPEMVEYAKGLTKAHILCGDVLCMSADFGRGAFDLITAMNLQHHLGREEEWKQFIRECRRTLRQGGMLVIREPDTTVLFKGLRWMTRHRFFFKIRLLRGRLQSLAEEKALLDYFLARWPKYHREYLKREGFQVIKDFCWMGHRIVVSRAQA